MNNRMVEYAIIVALIFGFAVLAYILHMNAWIMNVFSQVGNSI